MQPFEWLQLVQQLSQPERRLEVCAQIAARVGADELLLLVEDSEVGAYLPARGLKQRLPRSRSWREFIARVLTEGEHVGAIAHSERDPPVTARGRRLGSALVMVLVGGEPSQEAVETCAVHLTLLQSALALERSEISMRRELASARTKADQAANLARELDGTRRALQDALTQAHEANARASLLLEAGEVFTTSLEVSPILKSLCKVSLEQLCDACVVEFTHPVPTRESATRAGLESLVEERYLNAPERQNHLASSDAQLWSGADVLTEPVEDALARHVQLLPREVTSALFVPLRARSARLGHLTLLRASHRSFRPEDLRLAEELARRAELSLENARLYDDAQRAIRSRDEFLSVASHELRTPLTGMKLHVHTLQRAVNELVGQDGKPDLVRRFDVLAKQIGRLGKLVDQLLDVTRLKAGKLSLELEPIELQSLVRDIILRLQETAKGAGVELVLEESGPVRGLWDHGRLEQVVTNLVTNAIKYGGSRPVRVRVETSARGALICVRDQGIGIAPENFNRIFDQFERAVAAGRYEGLGLGLYITRQLVRAHGGEIVVNSVPGEGSTFTVELPLEPSSDTCSELREPSPRAVAEGASRTGSRGGR